MNKIPQNTKTEISPSASSYEDVHTNKVAGNIKIVRGKTFIPTNNYDLSQSLLVKSFKYDKWKPILISKSLILFKLL